MEIKKMKIFLISLLLTLSSTIQAQENPVELYFPPVVSETIYQNYSFVDFYGHLDYKSDIIVNNGQALDKIRPEKNTSGKHKCKRLKVIENGPAALIILNSNDGYGITTETFNVNPPSWAKCVYLHTIAVVETQGDITGGNTTSGIMYVSPFTGDPIMSVKTVARNGMEKFSNENTAFPSVPFDENGDVHFQQLNLKPTSSHPSTFTGVVAIVVGWYY